MFTAYPGLAGTGERLKAAFRADDDHDDDFGLIDASRLENSHCL
jgi:hypothetical protein